MSNINKVSLSLCIAYSIYWVGLFVYDFYISGGDSFFGKGFLVAIFGAGPTGFIGPYFAFIINLALFYFLGILMSHWLHTYTSALIASLVVLIIYVGSPFILFLYRDLNTVNKERANEEAWNKYYQSPEYQAQNKAEMAARDTILKHHSDANFQYADTDFDGKVYTVVWHFFMYLGEGENVKLDVKIARMNVSATDFTVNGYKELTEE